MCSDSAIPAVLWQLPWNALCPAVIAAAFAPGPRKHAQCLRHVHNPGKKQYSEIMIGHLRTDYDDVFVREGPELGEDIVPQADVENPKRPASQ